MKNRIVFIFLLFYLTGNAQTEYLPFAGVKTEKGKIAESYADITFGCVLQTPQVLKASISLNNILFHRLGFYSSVETDFSNFSNIYGVTATITSWAYIWGGADLFTKNGLLNKNRLDARKEVGVGLTPYKWIVVRMGYSSSVGPTLTGGVKIPLKPSGN